MWKSNSPEPPVIASSGRIFDEQPDDPVNQTDNGKCGASRIELPDGEFQPSLHWRTQDRHGIHNHLSLKWLQAYGKVGQWAPAQSGDLESQVYRSTSDCVRAKHIGELVAPSVHRLMTINTYRTVDLYMIAGFLPALPHGRFRRILVPFDPAPGQVPEDEDLPAQEQHLIARVGENYRHGATSRNAVFLPVDVPLIHARLPITSLSAQLRLSHRHRGAKI
jgi:hypothetical protein